MRPAAHVLRQDSPRFTLAAPPGIVDVVLHDDVSSGRWRYRLPAAGEVRIDMLDPELCSAPGAQALSRTLSPGFVPAPRLRLSVNGVLYELACADPAVLERHYARPNHQQVAYSPRPDRWLAAYHAARMEQARRLLRGLTGRVCDVGAGYSLLRMAGVPGPALRLAACDRDEAAVRFLRECGVDAVVGAAEDPPFPPGTFDAVYAGEIVEHLADPHGALRRWVSLLLPGGRLVVTTPNRRHLLTRVRGYELIENPEHLFEWDAGELCAAVERAGAQVTHLEGLMLPIPLYVPRLGWRDLGAGVSRRVPISPALLRRVMRMGRRVPRLAGDLAVVARRRVDATGTAGTMARR